MFFDLVLLRRQHKGRFTFAWIAGTRGVQHISKKDVLDLDVCILCNEITEYVCSTSDSPRSRFSLRLSAVLINGTLKIYKQKAVYVLEDLVKVLTGISRPTSLSLFPPSERTVFADTPPSPVTKKRGRKRLLSLEKNTPESQIEKIVADIRTEEMGRIEPLTFPEEPIILTARAEDITLRESVIQRPDEHVEEIGILGALPSEEELMREIRGMEKDVSVLPRTLPPIEEELPVAEPAIVPLEPAELSRLRRVRVSLSTSESEPEVGPVSVTTRAQVHAALDFEPPAKAPRREFAVSEPEIQLAEVIQPPVQVEEAVQIEEPRDVPTEVEKTIPSRRVLVEKALAHVEERDKEIKKMRERKKKDKDWSKLLISTKATRVVRIDRCEIGEIEWADIHPCPLPEFKLKTPNLTNLLNMYLIRDDVRDVQRRKKISEVSGLEDSVTLKRKSGQITPPAKVSLEEARPAPPVFFERVEEQPPVSEIQITVEAPQIPVETPLPEVQISAETQLPHVQASVEELQVTRPPITSTPLKRKTLEMETVEGVRAAVVEDEEISRRKRSRLLDVEPEPAKDLDFITLPSELPSRDLTSLAGEPVSIAEHTIQPVVLPVLTEQARQQEIVNKIFSSERLTLEEICQRPINKLNIARAFNDVLVLCKYRYVKLVSKDDSSELGYVERGTKMTR